MERFIWPAPPIEQIQRDLGEDERESLSHRAERVQFLWQEFGPPAEMLLIGGIPAMFALDEIKRSFAYGNFMATVMLSQVFVEHSLGGMYTLAGRDEIVSKGFAGLIKAALADGYITAELAQTLHALRKMRNPYTHHTIGVEARTYMGRLVENAPTTPEDLVVEDAKFAIRAIVDYLRHGSPNWRPDHEDWGASDA